MITAPDMLQKLRRTVLTHAIDGLPDLAGMATDLCALVEACRGQEDNGLAALINRARGHEQWLLGEHRQPQLSMMLMTWPANYVGPVYEQGRFWSVELVLQGAVRIEPCSVAGAESAISCEWLGAGDVRIIQPGRDGIGHYQTRNLSRSEMAVTLHVFGDSPAGYLSRVAEDSSESLTTGSRVAARPRPLADARPSDVPMG
ncbi:cupin domain-containing protein [Frateuria aurantia]